MSDPIHLRARTLAGLGPSLRKAPALSWEEHCEQRAIEAYGEAVDAGGGNRPVARHARCDESTIRDKRSGGRKKPSLADAWRLPKQSGYALVNALLDHFDAMPDSEVSNG